MSKIPELKIEYLSVKELTPYTNNAREHHQEDINVIKESIKKFGFSEQEILAEARNFAKNVNSIEFVSKDQMQEETNIGVYNPNINKISINQDYYMERENNSDFGLAMYSTLVHEVYHAINDHADESGYLGLSYKDSNSGQWVGSALNEVFTETAANRASYGKRIEDADRFRSETDGYGSLVILRILLYNHLRTINRPGLVVIPLFRLKRLWYCCKD